MSEASKTPEFTLRPPSTNILYLICAEHMKGPAMTGCVVCALTEAIDRAQRAEDSCGEERRLYSLVEQQSSKIAELEKDAARLDWWGGDIRNAIDKAMAEGKPPRPLASSGQGEDGTR